MAREALGTPDFEEGVGGEMVDFLLEIGGEGGLGGGGGERTEEKCEGGDEFAKVGHGWPPGEG